MKKQSKLHDEEIPLIKIVITGQTAVGKSNILSRYAYDKFYIGLNTTIGLQFVTKTVFIQGHPVNLEIWDTAGQQKFRALNRAFYRNALGGIMVFSLGDRKSFQKVPKWIQEMRECIDQPVIILVGNKCDLKEQDVTVSEATEFAKKQKMAYFETSAALNINIDKIFEILSKKVFEVYEGKEKVSKKSKVVSILSERDEKKSKKKQKCCEN